MKLAYFFLDKPAVFAWTQLVNRNQMHWKVPLQWDRICSNHFILADIENYLMQFMGSTPIFFLINLSVPVLAYFFKKKHPGINAGTYNFHIRHRPINVYLNVQRKLTYKIIFILN